MPNRIIKESIRTSYEIDDLSYEAEVTFYRLLTLADDYGRFQSDIRILQSQLFPLRPDIRSRDFSRWVAELVSAELIGLYVSDEKPYGHFLKWEKHQTIRSKKSKHPEPEGEVFATLEQQMQAIEIICKQVKSDVTVIQSNPIQSKSRGESGRSAPCSLSDVKEYFSEKGQMLESDIPLEAENFINHYEDKKWKNSAGEKITEWRRQAATWNNRYRQFNESRLKRSRDNDFQPEYMVER